MLYIHINICACAYLYVHTGIDAVIVGADRVVANGDTANKVLYVCVIVILFFLCVRHASRGYATRCIYLNITHILISPTFSYLIDSNINAARMHFHVTNFYMIKC